MKLNLDLIFDVALGATVLYLLYLLGWNHVKPALHAVRAKLAEVREKKVKPRQEPIVPKLEHEIPEAIHHESPLEALELMVGRAVHPHELYHVDDPESVLGCGEVHCECHETCLVDHGVASKLYTIAEPLPEGNTEGAVTGPTCSTGPAQPSEPSTSVPRKLLTP